MEKLNLYRQSPNQEKIIIDLAGPEGNVFSLIGMASMLLKKLGKNLEETYFVVQNMQQKDYNHALHIFEENLGHVTQFVNDPRMKKNAQN